MVTHVRLTLPHVWGSGIADAIGGRPVLCQERQAVVFSTGENFPSADLTSRQPRAGVGQLANGTR